MKTTKSFVGFLLLFVSISFIRCTPDQDISTTTKDIISQGKWTVDYYYAGQDRTSQFNTYEFSFVRNGTVTVATTSGDFSGTWMLMKDVSRNDVIQINIPTGEPHLAELNEQWNVTETTNTVIAMRVSTSSQLRLRKL